MRRALHRSIGCALAAAIIPVGCARRTPSGPDLASSPAHVDAPVDAAASGVLPVPVPSVPAGPARWTPGGDAGQTWTRSAGEHAPALVVRGTLLPTAPDDLATCEGMQGARFGAPRLVLRLEHELRALHVWGRARGPLGLRERDSGACAVVAPGGWAKLDLGPAQGEVSIDVADVDYRGQRRGQTSPYVIVVTDDDSTPAAEPDERSPLGPRDVTVRWALATAPCPPGLDGWRCARPTLQLGGAVTRTVPLGHLLLGQSGCWPDGTGVTCAGASGGSHVVLTTSAAGVVEVGEVRMSDGYCEPGQADQCQSVEAWTKLALPPGVHLVPDPGGTFPPAP